MVERAADGSYTIGPIPGIGGPFDTAAEFVQEFTKCLWFPGPRRLDPYIASILNLEQVLYGYDSFPDWLADLVASGKHFTREGPFPICHPDMFYHNVLYDNDFKTVGVIDFAGAITAPWELVGWPALVATPPPLFSAPMAPLEEEDAGRKDAELAYVAMVRQAEEDANLDHKLSDILSDRDLQDLATTINHFRKGKMADYKQVMDHYTDIYMA